VAHTMTVTFRDKDEDTWNRKLHIGCGGVYLDGYVNIDVQGLRVMGPDDVPADNKARIDEYYTVSGSMTDLPKSRDVYVDKKCSLTNTGYEVNSVDKIVCVQTLEHVSYHDARIALLHWWNIMKADAPLVLSVPDSAATLDLLLNGTTQEDTIRLLKGSLKDSYAAHLCWYDEGTITSLLQDMGFREICKLPNPHFYPAIVLRCKKYDPFMGERDYQPPIPAHFTGRILDVGPGTYPHPRATHFLDIEVRDDLSENGKTVTQFDLDDCLSGKLPFRKNYFEFVYCSHVLEHTKYPDIVMKELQRVGKYGYVEVPSLSKDLLLQFGNGHSGWDNTWSPDSGILMIERRKEAAAMYRQASGTLGRHMFIATHSTINTLDEDQIGIRMHFWQNQHLLNVWTSWSPGKDPKLVVLR